MKVKQDQFFPADILVLNTSLPKGICYVETKNLDGETNLKHKQVEKSILRLASSEQACIDNFVGAQIQCEGPNEYLYKFEGNLKFRDGATVNLDPDQILLRGSALRNTEQIIGICVYTGHQTKIMMNSTKTKSKKSKIQISTNKYILLTMCIQLVLSLSASLVLSIWTYYRGANYWYIYPNQANSE